MALPRTKIIIGLTLVLIVVIGVSVGLLITVPSGEERESAPEATPAAGRPTSPSTTPAGFNLNVFQTQAYQLLNQQLIEDGSLPVTPPTTVGKANPFQ